MTNQGPEDQLAIVLGQRQLIAVMCMFLVILGLVATLAYVAGRSITASQLRETERSAVPPAILVDPLRSPPAPTPLEARAETLPPVVVPAQTSTVVAEGEPVRGQSFWQIGIVDRGVGTVFVEHFRRQGLRARIAASQSAGGVRVLVGPLTNAEETQKTRRTLEAAGFQCYMKKF